MGRGLRRRADRGIEQMNAMKRLQLTLLWAMIIVAAVGFAAGYSVGVREGGRYVLENMEK